MAILDFDAKRNRYAIYEGGQDDAPLLNPLANLPRVKWHADLDYIGVTDHRTVTVDVNPRSFSGGRRSLLAHGKTFRPLVFGTAWINNKPVPTQGGLIIQVGLNQILCRVGADTSRVWLYLNDILGDGGFSSDPVMIRFELYVCNVGLSAGGALVTPAFFEGVEATATRFRAGKFDSNNKHFAYSATGNASLNVGPSISVQQKVNSLALRQNVNDYTADYNGPFQSFTTSVVRADVK